MGCACRKEIVCKVGCVCRMKLRRRVNVIRTSIQHDCNAKSYDEVWVVHAEKRLCGK